jgi:hypothetical protein
VFKLKEFQMICRVLGTYCSNSITPYQVIERARKLNREFVVKILSDAFERMPGHMNETIQDFIDAMRLKVLIE